MPTLDAREHDTWDKGRSFTIRNIVYRAIWNLVWFALASWTPPQLRLWRILLLRLFGAKIAKGAGVYGSARVWSPRNLEMGRSAFIGPRVTVYTIEKIVMGPYSLASQGAFLCTGTHDIDDPHFQLKAKPIHIKTRAWIAAEAFVGPGVVVGEGAVLGARGVAFRDLEPWTVYVGNPATPQRRRNLVSGKNSDPPQKKCGNDDLLPPD